MNNNYDIFTGAQIRHHANRHYAGGYPESLTRHLNLAMTAEAMREISAWQDYQPTPLHSLADFATEFKIDKIYYKDESNRFGLGSFKALGGAYAVSCLLREKIRMQTGAHATASELESGKFSKVSATITVVTATAGNHGCSVAWGAARFGCRCRIYIHAGVSERRRLTMQELGAEVVRIRGNYDDSVRAAAADATANGWHVVSDTSYPGYTQIPGKVMAGYGVMFEETMKQLPHASAPTHLFVQGGVGGLAAAAAAYLWEKLADVRPRFIVVEPESADCLFQSAVNNCATEVTITRETIMAGLSCGEVSEIAWEVLALATDDFITITDELIAPLMRLLAHHGIEGGESGVAGLAGCLAVCENPKLRSDLDLTEQSRVLVFGTEGATDREIYQKLIS